MPEPTPTLEEWGRLYQAAMAFKDLSPWQWMEETDVFGVQNPDTGDLGFVSVMGLLGEHLSLALYLGAKSLRDFWIMEQTDLFPQEVSELPLHLQASFEDRNTLTKKDRDIIKELGLKFRGRQAWPMFRSYRPGFLPWYLEASEARFLACALEQAVEVAQRFKQDPEMLRSEDPEAYLVRVAHEGESGIVWEDQRMTIALPEPDRIFISLNVALLEHVNRSPRGK